MFAWYIILLELLEIIAVKVSTTQIQVWINIIFIENYFSFVMNPVLDEFKA